MCFPLHTHTILCFSDNVNIYFRFFIVLSSIYERCLVMYEIFEQLLQRYGVTAYKVSKETGITQSTLSDWKRGRSAPKTENMKKIADYFGVTIDYLLSGENESKEKKSPYSDLQGIYLSYAKEAQDNGIDPDDIKLALETIIKLRGDKK